MTTPLSGEGLPANLTDGLWLRGQYLSSKVQHGRPRDPEKPDGERWPDRQIVTILTGDRTVQVEYANEDAAQAALGPAVATDEVVIPVGVRAAKNFVFYYGRRS